MTQQVVGVFHAGIAINAYRSSPLRGCLQDLLHMRGLLGQYGYLSDVITDSEATRDGILAFLREQVARVGPHAKLVLTYSGHGASGPSSSEADRTDECWVGQDMRPVWDDEIAACFAEMDPQGQATIISDSCYSATVHRAVALGVEDRGDGYRAARYVALSELDGVNMNHAEDVLAEDRQPRGHTLVGHLANVPRSVWLFAACQADQVTYDAVINGVAQGCYTRVLIDSWAALQDRHADPHDRYGWQPTNRELHREIRRRLPSEDYDNRPWAGGLGGRSLVFAVDERR